MPYRKIIIIPLSLFLISGCEQKEPNPKDIIKNMAFIQGGTFEMGDICLKKYGQPCTFANEGASFPVHTVTVDSFYIAKYKVTYKDYDLYTSNKDLASLKIDKSLLKLYPKLRNSNNPATANWQLSKDYCKWVGINAPSYQQQKNFSGLGAGLLPVGQYPTSPLGLFDMGTNGQEWMRDWYNKTYYQHSEQNNPTGPTDGTEKSLRGMPAEDSRSDDAAPTATTMFRMGKEPLLKDFPPDLWDKYNGDFEKAATADTENDPYKIAKRGFSPGETFRCVINAQSLPEKYR